MKEPIEDLQRRLEDFMVSYPFDTATRARHWEYISDKKLPSLEELRLDFERKRIGSNCHNQTRLLVDSLNAEGFDNAGIIGGDFDSDASESEENFCHCLVRVDMNGDTYLLDPGIGLPKVLKVPPIGHCLEFHYEIMKGKNAKCTLSRVSSSMVKIKIIELDDKWEYEFNIHLDFELSKEGLGDRFSYHLGRSEDLFIMSIWIKNEITGLLGRDIFVINSQSLDDSRKLEQISAFCSRHNIDHEYVLEQIRKGIISFPLCR